MCSEQRQNTSSSRDRPILQPWPPAPPTMAVAPQHLSPEEPSISLGQLIASYKEDPSKAAPGGHGGPERVCSLLSITQLVQEGQDQPRTVSPSWRLATVS